MANATKTEKNPLLIKTLLGTESEINKVIKNISTYGKRMDNWIHQAAVSAMALAEKPVEYTDKNGKTRTRLQGEVRPLTRLMYALPNGTRKNALLTYIVKFGKVEWDSERVIKDCTPEGKTGAFVFKSAKPSDIDRARRVHWTNFKANEGGEMKPMDLDAAVIRIIQQAEKHVKAMDEGKAPKGDNISLKKLASLKELFPMPVEATDPAPKAVPVKVAA